MSTNYRDRDWLYEKYVVEQRPATELAELAGCHFATIYYWLRKHGIHVRSQSESRQVVFQDPAKRAERARSQAALWKDPDYRRRQMAVRRSEDFQDRQSRTIRKVWEDPEYYARQCEASQKLWQDPDYREKTLRALLARWDDPEYVQAHRDRLAKLWEDADYRKMMSEKMSAMLEELWQDPDYRERKATEMSKRVRALWETAEFRELQQEKASLQMQERWQEPEWRDHMSEVVRELWDDPGHRIKMSARMRERWQDPEWREFFSAFMVEKWQDPEYRQTILAFLRDPERIERHREMMLELWDDQDFVASVTLDFMSKVSTGYRTDIEAITEEALQELSVAYEFEHRVGRYSVDFHLPTQGIVIECDGEYWHRDKERDANRDAYLQEQGLTVLHLHGPDIRTDVRALLERELLPLLRE